MEKPTFEESLREAFRGAEAGPSENVWNNIELDLMKAESGKMKRRVLFYQLLAAASITFALLTIGISWYNKSNEETPANQIAASNNAADADRNTINSTDSEAATKEAFADRSDAAQQNGNVNNIAKENKIAEFDEKHTMNEIASPEAPSQKGEQNNGSLSTEETFNHRAADNVATLSENNISEGTKEAGNFQTATISGSEKTSSQIINEQGADGDPSSMEKELPELYTKREIQPEQDTKPEESVADPGALLLAKLKDLENELAGNSTTKKKGKDVKENLWTSVGFAAGGFNTTNPTVSAQTQSNIAYSNTVNNQSKASGTSYSFGLSMGTRISERFVIQGGVNYLTQNSNYTSEQVVSSGDFMNFKTATLNDFREVSSTARVISTAPYSVNNNVEFFSVPMQAGYVVINRKFALQLNAGVSTDFYLKNTIDPEGSGLEKTTQERGADSPYRSLNFSGLMNTELSYRLSDRYRVSVNPGIRYPFNSIYKDEIGINATPITFDVGLRFKYIFQ